MSRLAGLPGLAATVQSAVCKAFLTPTAPVPRRESLPLSISFVAWLEREVCSSDSPMFVIQDGAILCLIWASRCAGVTHFGLLLAEAGGILHWDAESMRALQHTESSSSHAKPDRSARRQAEQSSHTVARKLPGQASEGIDQGA